MPLRAVGAGAGLAIKHRYSFLLIAAENVLVCKTPSIGLKIAALDLQEYSTADRDMIVETLTSLKNTLEEALSRCVKSG